MGNEGVLILLEYDRYLLLEIALAWCEQYSDRGQDALLPTSSSWSFEAYKAQIDNKACETD